MAQKKSEKSIRKPSGMAQNERFIPHGSPEHESMLAAGYGGMTRAKAEQIIRERKDNPLTHPYERLEQAEAFLAALDSPVPVVATRKGWRRDRTSIR